MSEVILSDQNAREIALNHTGSYIVQAPAGSGKTELLSQRVLNLLAHVNKPEEIVALTFTRKAAAEMRARIIESLQNAKSDIVPDAHKVTTNNLAKKVLQQDNKLGWNLLANPSRLNITTIDSLCAKIAKQTPVLSQLGGSMEISDEPVIYYQQAIAELFKLINTDNYDQDCDWTTNLKILLQHFGSNYLKLQTFLLDMLYKREQWLPYIASASDENMHELLQYCWQELASDVIKSIEADIPLDIITELNDILGYASFNLEHILALETELSDTQLMLISASESETASKLGYWQAVSYLLFAASDKLTFRKRLDKRLGFFTKTAFKDQESKQKSLDFKNRMMQVIADVQCLVQANKTLLDDFILLRKLPDFDYSHDNWQLLAVLFKVLSLLEAQLRVILRNKHCTDFSGITQAALYALGDFESPSDINLYFDYSIKHILVDEFQDTSFTQYQLLKKLTMLWEPQEGKTLFLVGDPQQSIYKFRQAEVGLFLQVKQHGLGNIKLEYLALNQNFRSEQQVVDWVNAKFVNIFPQESNILLGAVSYDNSVATKEKNSDLNPSLHLFEKMNDHSSQNTIP